MILYTVTGNAGQEGYKDISQSGDIKGKNIYVNMTNRCPCHCVFCLRQTKEMLEGNSLWLKDGEPTAGEVIEKFSLYNLALVNEIVFCGFGEPLERLTDVCTVIDALRKDYKDLRIRINTIGLANLIYGRDITPELRNRVDTLSISLNATSAEEFQTLTRSDYGIRSYEAVREFAVLAKRYVPNVVMTVVDQVMSPEKIEICRNICEELGVMLRVRPFEN